MCSSSPGLAKISFTGSTTTGRRIMAEAAKQGIPTCMELGGKSCLIVFDDANVDDAVEWAMVRDAASLLHALFTTLHGRHESVMSTGPSALKMLGLEEAVCRDTVDAVMMPAHSSGASGRMGRSAAPPRGCWCMSASQRSSTRA